MTAIDLADKNMMMNALTEVINISPEESAEIVFEVIFSQVSGSMADRFKSAFIKEIRKHTHQWEWKI